MDMQKVALGLFFHLAIFSVEHSYAEPITIIDHVNVIPMDEERILKDYRVIVDDGIIVGLEPSSKKSKIKADRIINATGKFLMPGFSDTHYHQSGLTQAEFELQYKQLIANGITSVRSMGEFEGQDTIEIRSQANDNNPMSPYYFTTGPIIDAYMLKTVDEALKMVEMHKKRGYDFIKVHENYPLDVYLTILNEAEKAGIPVVGHAQRDKPLEYTLRLASIAHIEELVMVFSDEDNLTITDFSEEMLTSIAKQVKQSGIYVSPTLTIVAKIQDYTDKAKFSKLKSSYESSLLPVKEFINYTTYGSNYLSDKFATPQLLKYVDDIIKSTQKLTLALYKEGVPMLVGSDNFGMQSTGFSYHDEMDAMNKAGMSNYAVLNSATTLSARFLRRYATAGTINIGKKAELVLLNGNPLENIKNTRLVEGVMLKGHWFDRSALDQMLNDVKLARDQERSLLSN